MKMTYLLICFIFLINSTFSNKKDNVQSILTYSYIETQCTDPWGATGLKMDEKKAQLKSFFKKQKIEWRSIQVKQENPLKLYCEGCGCKTGFTFFVNIEDKFSKKIEDIGFKRIE